MIRGAWHRFLDLVYNAIVRIKMHKDEFLTVVAGIACTVAFALLVALVGFGHEVGHSVVLAVLAIILGLFGIIVLAITGWSIIRRGRQEEQRDRQEREERTQLTRNQGEVNNRIVALLQIIADKLEVKPSLDTDKSSKENTHGNRKTEDEKNSDETTPN